jgi:hypothetical protein
VTPRDQLTKRWEASGRLTYRLTPNIQVDIRAGIGPSDRPNDFFTGTRFSVRF